MAPPVGRRRGVERQGLGLRATGLTLLAAALYISAATSVLSLAGQYVDALRGSLQGQAAFLAGARGASRHGRRVLHVMHAAAYPAKFPPKSGFPAAKPFNQFPAKPGGTFGASGLLSVDVFEIPRGLLHGRLWECPADEAKKPAGRDGLVKIRKIRASKTFVIQDFFEGPSTALLDEPDCKVLTEDDLDPEEYARLVTSLIRRATRRRRDRTQRWSKHMQMDVRIETIFTYKGFSNGGRSLVSVAIESSAVTPECINLGFLKPSEQTAAAILGMKVMPIGKEKLDRIWFVSATNDYFGLVLNEKNRAELLGYTKDQESKVQLYSALAGEMLISAQADSFEPAHLRRNYTYLASALRPKLSLHATTRLQGLDGWPTGVVAFPLKQMMLGPVQRQKIIQDELDWAVDTLQWKKPLRRETQGGATEFRTLEPPLLVFAKGGTAKADTLGASTWNSLASKGMHHLNPDNTNVTLVGIILGSKDPNDRKIADVVLPAIQKKIASAGIKVSGTNIIEVTQANLNNLTKVLAQAHVGPGDAVLLFGTKGLGSVKSEKMREALKNECFRGGVGQMHVASQWFNIDKPAWQKVGNVSPMLAEQDASIMNCAAGLLAKLGHTPWGISGGLWAKDSSRRQVVVAGLDVCHLSRGAARSSSSRGRAHIVAGTRLSSHYPDTQPEVFGKFEAQMEHVHGENMPYDTIKRLIPKPFASGRVVIVHREGHFNPEEIRVFEEYKDELDASTAFVLVEVIKDRGGVPRMYMGTSNPSAKGVAAMLTPTKAVLVTTVPSIGSPTPLGVWLRQIIGKVDPIMEKEGWLSSVYDLSFMHYSSLYRKTRLPSTTHFADRLAYMLAQAGGDPEVSVSMGDATSQQYWL